MIFSRWMLRVGGAAETGVCSQIIGAFKVKSSEK